MVGVVSDAVLILDPGISESTGALIFLPLLYLIADKGIIVVFQALMNYVISLGSSTRVVADIDCIVLD